MSCSELIVGQTNKVLFCLCSESNIPSHEKNTLKIYIKEGRARCHVFERETLKLF